MKGIEYWSAQFHTDVPAIHGQYIDRVRGALTHWKVSSVTLFFNVARSSVLRNFPQLYS